MRKLAAALSAALVLLLGTAPAQAAAGPVKPTPGTVNQHKVQWISAKPYKQKSLKVTWWGGPQECRPLARVKVTETKKKVTVTLYEGSIKDNGMCIMIAVKKSTIIKLKAPLGKRKVVDGAR
ncbi:hypothetical protein [Acrocarpospora catenulata]|uniref:hypothetical protein n=1 Tax=Acrocarpospora catenulata TaxID=2836182 RepID=UPI001BDAFCDE|nr:hypothetical protein [Acrocarpospora catenulata]